ncbi:Nucleoporin NDC1 [Blyttiomyces sp. JEL0837]|nr:Nucleoporin NDC1 [Blyttiomyces sp. JEL0837]
MSTLHSDLPPSMQPMQPMDIAFKSNRKSLKDLLPSVKYDGEAPASYSAARLRRYEEAQKQAAIIALTTTTLFAFPFSISWCLAEPLAYCALADEIHHGEVTRVPIARIYMWDLKLAIHVYLGMAFSIVAWEVLSKCIEAIYTEPLHRYREENGVVDVIKGLVAKKGSYEQSLALLDLHCLSRLSKKARAEIFVQLSQMDPSAWASIGASCLGLVNMLSELNNKKKKPGKDKGMRMGPNSPRQAILRDEKIVRDRPRTFFETITSAIDYGLKDTKKPDEVRPAEISKKLAADIQSRNNYENLPVYLRPETRPAVNDVVPKVAEEKVRMESAMAGDGKSKTAITSTGEILQGILASGISAVAKYLDLNSERKVLPIQLVCRETFSDIQIVVWAIEAVATLLVAASKEDKYGTIQKDLPAVLESFLRCLCAVELFIDKPPGLPTSSKSDQGQILFREPVALVKVLKTSTYSITNNFYEHLSQYEFDARWSSKLMSFTEYAE